MQFMGFHIVLLEFLKLIRKQTRQRLLVQIMVLGIIFGMVVSNATEKYMVSVSSSLFVLLMLVLASLRTCSYFPTLDKNITQLIQAMRKEY